MDTPHETASECYNMSRRRSGRREVGIGIGHHRVGIGIGRHEVGIGIGKIYFSATIPYGEIGVQSVNFNGHTKTLTIVNNNI